MKLPRFIKKTGSAALALSELAGVVSLLEVRKLDIGTEECDDARRLAAGVFLKLGKLDPDHIDPETGLPFNDRLLPHATIYGAYRKDNDELIATMRRNGSSLDQTRTPFEQLPAESVELLEKFSPGSITELASFTRKPQAKLLGRAAGLALTRRLVMESNQEGVEAFIAGIEPHVAREYMRPFGDISTILSDNPVHYPGVIGGQTPVLFHFGKDLAEAKARQSRSAEDLSLKEQAILALIRSYFSKPYK